MKEKHKGWLGVRLNPKMSLMWDAIIHLEAFAEKTDADVLYYIMLETLKNHDVDTKKLLAKVD